MKRAAQELLASALFAGVKELHAPVWAGVDKGSDLEVFTPYNDH
jgi:hypothetical protein